jgi:tetratricopeptide (TPR) repeat protein
LQLTFISRLSDGWASIPNNCNVRRASGFVKTPRLQPAFEETAAKLVGLSEVQAKRAGVGLWQAKEYAKAASMFERLAAEHPTSATTWTNLAVNYKQLGQRRKAEDAFRKARSLDPHNDFVLRSLESFHKDAPDNILAEK